MAAATVAAGVETRRAGALEELRRIVERSRRLVLITGAGLSTESGIPDYRSPGRPPHKPVQHSEFVKHEHSRKRYWSRSFAAYDAFFNLAPNVGHRAIAEFENSGRGRLHHVITQNVDQLHQRAGTSPERLIELHGSLRTASCLSCGAVEQRPEIQRRLQQMNPDWPPQAARPAPAGPGEPQRLRPDGDVELASTPEVYAQFRIPHCLSCGGILKPNVVFFGGAVERRVAETAAARTAEADALVVAGSSLATYSAYRLVLLAAERGVPVAIATDGPTRADPLAAIKVEERLGRVLPAVLLGREP